MTPDSKRVFVFLLCSTLLACRSSQPTQPSSSASISAPEQISPAADAQIGNGDQPVTLVVRNASSQGVSSAITYTFDVATDAAFTTMVATKAGVAENAGGQTSVAIDRLNQGTYYWRARGVAGSTTGTASGARKFVIGPAVTISTPSAISPADGASTTRRPTLRVSNVTSQGALGAITYKFEVSTTSAFSSVLVSVTKPEGSGETGYIFESNLPGNTTLYWRVTALDAASGSASSPSAVRSLKTQPVSEADIVAEQAGYTLWPVVQPPGTPGHTRMSAGWDVDTHVSYDGVPFQNPPIEALRLFDLIDRDLDPQAAIDWLSANGYPSTGQWYAGVDVIGIPHVYLALIDGAWELVLRAGG
jgi:hypothetical protein